jgi:cysteine desulfuration protein SufE
MTTTIADRQAALVSEFQARSQDERYTAIIAKGRDHIGLPEAAKTEANQLRGCASAAWFTAQLVDGKVHYQGQAEAIMSNGLIALMIDIYDNQAPDDIVAHPPTFIEELGLGASLSANRANGLASMAKQINAYAAGYQLLLSKGIKNHGA